MLYRAKRIGMSDREIAGLWNMNEVDIFRMREENGIMPVYKMIDTCASEFESYIPYFYSTYEEENESRVSEKKKVIVLGSGPIRIGQGVEFDYSTVHAVQTIQKAGYEAIVINNNPETVSTDYTCSDKLYFEPLCVEDVMNIIRLENPEGVIVTLGGQTAVNLAEPLAKRGVKILGTDCDAIDKAENRDSFEHLLLELNIPQPTGRAVTSIEEGIEAAKEIGYPVLVRPSFVLGGRAMQIVAKEESLWEYMRTAVQIDEDKPVLVDRYIRGKEVEVDAVCDGTDVFVPGIMELVERTGVHSGDSISVYPSYSLSDEVKKPTQRIRMRSSAHPRPVQHPVHRGSHRHGLHHRGEPEILENGTVPLEGDGLPARGHRNPGIPGRLAEGAGHHGDLSEGEAALLCEGSRIFLLEAVRHGRVSLAGDEVHRRGHRLRQAAAPRGIQGSDRVGSDAQELRHGPGQRRR